MSLKTIVDGILKDQHRSLSWLAEQMSKTFDGLRLGLIKESIKYKDILLMAQILNVSPCDFFELPEKTINPKQSTLAEAAAEYGDNLKNCRELNTTLKDQLKDKERIISLLTQSNNEGRSL